MTNYKKAIILISALVALLSSNGLYSFPKSLIQPDSTNSWPSMDQLCELPFQTIGVKHPVTSLNGEWEFCKETNQEKWDTQALTLTKIIVPGEPAMQGHLIQHDTWYAYRKQINIPKDFSGKTIMLRFNGVYSHAKVWINGTFLREHHGGFTAWECDITPYIRSGEKAMLTVAFSDRRDDISYASGYAKHPIGGILRNVEMIALSKTYISDLYTETTFDSTYTNSMLSATISVKGVLKGTKVKIGLTSPAGKPVKLNNSEIVFDKITKVILQNSIQKPQQWEAEHPNLYELTAEISLNGKLLSTVRKKVGFRQLQIKQDQLLVNGRPVKLRGACRHDIHPLMGRSASDEYDLKDVLLAKEANMNFIRTSHYPPSRAFLEYCDLYGIYVEEETAICFVSSWRLKDYLPQGSSENDTAFTPLYLGQLSEMIERDRNHASVIIWSIGNENKYGLNFKKEYDLVKNTDRSRPVIFSYPGFAGDNKIYDILSLHYVSTNGSHVDNGVEVKNFSSPGIPVLHDEWAHVPCYNAFTLSGDPNVHDFWGESMDRMWSGCFASKGALGGAIWGMIDETFMLPDTCVGYGQWGIIDTWRRPKPEFWNTKKAYSPVRLSAVKNTDITSGKDISLDLQNRFDHTNIAELKITCNGQQFSSPQIAPHSVGKLIIPENKRSKGKSLNIAFYLGEMMIDRYTIDNQLTTPDLPTEPEKNTDIEVVETDTQVEVSGNNFKVTFNKHNGLISSAVGKAGKIIDSGPYLTLVTNASSLPNQKGDELVDAAGEWKLTQFSYQKTAESFTATVHGTSGIFPVKYVIRVNGNGEISTEYTVENNPQTVHEAGIYYQLSKDLDQLNWKRTAYWTAYPEGHLGRPQGMALKLSQNSDKEQYLSPPVQSWENDTKDFYLFQKTGKRKNWLPVSNEFRSSKLNILSCSLTCQATGTGILVIGDGRLSARSEVNADASIKLLLLDRVSYSDLDWGNYERPNQIGIPFQSQVKIKLIQ